MSHCKPEDQEMSTPLVNLIVVQHLDPSIYHKVMDGYDMGLLYWYSKNLEAIESDLVLIDQIRVLTNTQKSMASVAIRSLTDCRW